jgi:hypothetical protein
MMKQILVLTFLLSFSLATIRRNLQKTEAKAPKADGYTPLQVPAETDDWKQYRDDYYKTETLRLEAEQRFHTSEFGRYNRQQKWVDDRVANETDNTKTMAARVRKDLEIDEQARIDIDEGDAHINFKQNMRNPANRIAARAARIYEEHGAAAWTSRVDQLKNLKIPAQPKAVVKRRALQAQTGYSANQTNNINQIKAAWAKRAKDLQAQIDLNLKFHAVEFEEFVLDTHRIEDVKAINESDLSLKEKRDVKYSVWEQYNGIKNPTKAIINAANQARKEAQNTVNGDENEVKGLAERNSQYVWATKA